MEARVTKMVKDAGANYIVRRSEDSCIQHNLFILKIHRFPSCTFVGSSNVSGVYLDKYTFMYVVHHALKLKAAGNLEGGETADFFLKKTTHTQMEFAGEEMTYGMLIREVIAPFLAMFFFFIRLSFSPCWNNHGRNSNIPVLVSILIYDHINNRDIVFLLRTSWNTLWFIFAAFDREKPSKKIFQIMGKTYSWFLNCFHSSVLDF